MPELIDEHGRGVSAPEAAKMFAKVGTLTIVGLVIGGYLMYSWLIKR